MRYFKLLQLPTPIRVGSGLYEPWRDDCKRVTLIDRMPEVSQDEPAILEIEVPAEMHTGMALTVLAWCDRLVHELVLPDHPIREYRLVRSWHPEELLIKLWVGKAEPWSPPPKEVPATQAEGAPAGAAASNPTPLHDLPGARVEAGIKVSVKVYARATSTSDRTWRRHASGPITPLTC